MSNREVMQQALEALSCIEYGACGVEHGPSEDTTEAAIAALKAALAKFDADPQNAGQAQTESKQEPVAWMVYTEGGKSAYVTDNPTDLVGAYRALPLYTR